MTALDALGAEEILALLAALALARKLRASIDAIIAARPAAPPDAEAP